jgi:dipeptidyl aminopeptidase/acylaminoacyl peptidase
MEYKEVNEKQEEINLSPERAFPSKKSGINFKLIFIIFTLLIAILLGAAAVAALFILRDGTQVQTSMQSKLSDIEVISEETPFPFEELTIPYLRERRYESSLSELEQISSNSNYSSYLSSYTSDGLRINGLLTRPTEQMPEKGFPAIVFVHGYIPPTTYQTNGQSYSDYVDYLAKSGFVVFKIDLRGHGNSEGEPGGAYYSDDYIIDTLNARSALQKLDFVNPERIGLWGHSMAGNVTFRSFVVARDIPAISIWAGAVYTYDDWKEFGLNDNSYRPPGMSTDRQRKREELFATHGEFDSNSEFWKMVAPVNYLEGLMGAVQLNHAVNDDVINIGYSRGLNSILNNTSIIHELNEYQNGGHNITGSAFTQAMQDTVRFFRENL